MEVRRRSRSRDAEGKDLLRESKAFPDWWFMGRSRQYGYDRRHQADETIVDGRAAHKAFCWLGKRGGSPKRFIGRLECDWRLVERMIDSATAILILLKDRKSTRLNSSH